MFVFQSLLMFLFTTLIFCVIKFRWNRRRLYELAAKLPGDNGVPLLGILPRLALAKRKDYLDIVLGFIRDDTPITRVWLGPYLMVGTNQPEIMHAVFNSPQCYDKPSIFYGSLIFTNGLLPLSGKLHEKHRKIFNKAFIPRRLQHLYGTVNKSSKVCIQKLAPKVNQDDFDVYYYIGACSLESFGLVNLNYHEDLYGHKILPYVDAGFAIGMKRIQQPWLNTEFIFRRSKLSTELDEMMDVAKEYLDRIVNHNKKLHMESNGSIKDDRVIDLLLDPDNEFSDQEILDELVIFALTSFDSTAKSISSGLLMLAMHQEIQQKLINEIDSICGTEKELTFDNDFLQRFTYLDLIVKETIRLFPAGPIVARETSDEIDICGYKIPKKTIMVMSIFAMQRDPKYWGDDAHLYRPERFENLENPQAYLPFTGHRYAMIVIKTFLINFFRAYKIDTTLKYENLKIEMSVVLTILNRYMISIKKR
ncbi:unnamed protein product [Chironomus riparius]|uniref:Cytochrome P450 n=1 Tax=Chironomus riparius TaxID=315576 RepID=A0A9N9S5R7_9DIPT|nr:unnamed protein product [Chironomus riparius]